MKIIRTNKYGKNIHSPFIYRLVANVLFAPYPFYAFAEIEYASKKRLESKQLKLIFRMVNSFRFKQVYSVGANDPLLGKTCRMANPGIQFLQSETLPTSENKNGKNYNRLLVFHKSIGKEELDRLPGFPEVWVIRNKKEKSGKEFFALLRTRQKVNITIDLNCLGIVIFNEIFEKQDYVIKY